MKNSFEYLERECKKIFIMNVLKIASSFVGVIIISVVIYKLIPQKEEKKVVIIKENIKPKEEKLVLNEKFTKNKIFEETKEIIRSLESNKSKKTKSVKREESILELKTNINLEDIEKIYKKREEEVAKRREIEESKKRVINKEIPPANSNLAYKSSNQNNPNIKNSNFDNEPSTPQPTSIKFEVKEYKGITSLKSKYMRDPSYNLAVKIANTYIQSNDFQNAVEWALKASRYDSSYIEPWLIYAKAKYNLGQKEKAIEVLEFINRKKDSKQVQRLLATYKKDAI